MEKTRVLIVDDEALVRRALRVFLDSSSTTTVVGEAKDGAAALSACRELGPDVVLMDLQMPTMNGVEATAAIVREFPGVRVLAVTTFSSERHVVSALRAGASGYLVKDSTPEEIVSAVGDVHAGRSVLSPQIARELISVVRHGAEGEEGRVLLDLPEALTSRELSIVKLLAQGLSNAEIARGLHIAEGTVKSNLARVMVKWDARDRVQVLIHAAREGIVTL